MFSIKKSKTREQFPQNFEDKNNEIFIYWEGRIFYRESSVDNMMIMHGCTLGQKGKCDLMSESSWIQMPQNLLVRKRGINFFIFSLAYSGILILEYILNLKTIPPFLLWFRVMVSGLSRCFGVCLIVQ